jgi:hypothetical protein
LTVLGVPTALDPVDLASSVSEARQLLNEESIRAGPSETRDPGVDTVSAITDSDLAALRAKFPFLKEFSDGFIRSNKPDCIMRMETANMKLKEAERAKDADDRLAHNRSNIGVISVDMGLDDRTNVLHDGRFLPGANCSAVKLWLAARARTPLHGAPPLGNYDMACVGLGGFVSSRGWVELANPASTRLSLKHFNINSCARRVSSKKSDSEDSGLQEITELGEFQLALRTLRTAAAFVMPWNFSFTALENFIINSRYCKADLGEIDNKAQILSQFCDYVLAENASKWRDSEPFLSSGELKNTWNAFFSARPQSAFSKKEATKQSTLPSQKKFNRPNVGFKKLPFIDVCYNWNKGTCNNQAGACFSSRGIPLRHVCDHRTDPSNLSLHCGQNHRRLVAHP